MSNDGVKRFRALPKYTPRGLPDIIVLAKGVFFGLEVKRPKAKLRPEQEIFRENVIQNGGRYYKVENLETVQNIFSPPPRGNYASYRRMGL